MAVTNPYKPAIVRTVLPKENAGVSRKKKVKYILFLPTNGIHILYIKARKII